MSWTYSDGPDGKRTTLVTHPADQLPRWTETGPISATAAPRPPPPVIPHIRQATNGPLIAVVNMSSVYQDVDLFPLVEALQIQVDRDFAPIWKMGANLIAIAKGHTVPPGAWVVMLLDTSDEPDALGYHDLTPEGLPLSKVFVKSDIAAGLRVSITASHEVLEMILDPYITDTVFVQTTNIAGVLYAREVCDAVEDDSLGYPIRVSNGQVEIVVSDFVTPAWFENFRPAGSTAFSFRRHVNAPFELAPGGYIGFFTVGPHMTGWDQRFAELSPMGVRGLNKSPGSRTMRRFRFSPSRTV